MGCKLTHSITRENCNYDLAGISDLYLINHDSANQITVEDGVVKTIKLPEGEKAYRVEFANSTASFTDELAEGGNGAKYRTHTLNFSVSGRDHAVLNEGDKLSLGRFTAIVVDKNKKAMMLGRNNGLSATSFNYESGAADADARGWTVVMAGTEVEIAPVIVDMTVLDAVADKPVVVTE